MEFARAQGWQPRVQRTLVRPLPSSLWYAVAPQGDRYLIGDVRGSEPQLELYKSSGELLWKRHTAVDNPVFSQDGTQIFTGVEALETATGKVVARAPLQKSDYPIVWAASGSRVALQGKNGIHVWDRATNKTRSIVLKDYTLGTSTPRLSPDGKWLATMVYDANGRGNVALWNLTKSTNPELYPIGILQRSGFSLTFSPDSQRLLYAGIEATAYSLNGAEYASPRDIVSIWTLDNSRSTYEFSPRYPALAAVWSPDGKTVALRGRYRWSMYSTESGENLWSASHRTISFLNELYFTKDNKLHYYDYSEKGWSLEYWDLARVLPPSGGNQK